MLTLSDVGKAYGGRTLFSGVTFQVNRGERVGLVGVNGAGKSTLFRLILRQEEPDAGSVAFQRGVTVGFLPQESAPVGPETILELACTRAARFAGVAPTTPSEPPVPDLHADWMDGPAVARARRILKGLAFREPDMDRPAREFSGGWVMRAHLARLLVSEPDLLMLDEPTNHLDLETLLWFQNYLKSYPGGILLISHDREFINQLATGILEIRNGRLWRYAGDYDAFLEQRAAQEEQQEAAWKNQQREIARLMEFVDRFRAKNTKAKQAQAKLKQIDRMEKVEAPTAGAARMDFVFPQPETSGQRVLTLQQVRFGYGATPVYDGLDLELERGARIVLVGPNGAGKSTLLKLLAGVVDPQAGTRETGLRVKAGYYSQHRADMLRAGRTVLEEAIDTPARVTELYVRTLLGCFLFSGDAVHKPVGVLSGGEKSRLALVKLLLDPPNLLLLDEPTTHLDMASIDALVAALSEYTGTLVFISHDVHFIRATATRVWHIDSGRLTPYAGDYDYYLAKSRAGSAREALTATLHGTPAGRLAAAPALANAQPGRRNTPHPPPQPAPATAPALSQKERRQQAADRRRALAAHRRRVTDLEREIAELEARQTALTQDLEDPLTYQVPGRANELNRQVLGVVERLEKVTHEWEAAAGTLAAQEAAARDTLQEPA